MVDEDRFYGLRGAAQRNRANHPAGYNRSSFRQRLEAFPTLPEPLPREILAPTLPLHRGSLVRTNHV